MVSTDRPPLGDTFLLSDIRAAQDLAFAGKPSEALVLLRNIEVPVPHDEGRSLHIWFQVTLEKIRCYTQLQDLDQALALADRIVLVDPAKLAAVSAEFWVSGFVAVIFRLMRTVDRYNCLSVETFQAYRDFFAANKHLDDNIRGVKVYGLYLLGLQLSQDMRSTTPTGVAFDALVESLTQDNIDLLANGHITLLDYLQRALTIHGQTLQKDAATMERVAAFSLAVASLPRNPR